MKKFAVTPRFCQEKEILVGSQYGKRDEFVFLGRLSESGAITRVNFDLSSEHVIAIFGKRGSGKSYTLGSILEGLCTTGSETTISKISKTRGVLLFDTLGIFQWFDIPLDQGSAVPIIQEQSRPLKEWGIQPEKLDVQIWIPVGMRSESTPKNHRDFSIKSSDFTAADWGYLLGLDIFQDRMGQLLNDVYIKTTEEGWEDQRHTRHPPIEDYSIDNLIGCIRDDVELIQNYQSETRRAVTQQLSTYDRNPLFQGQGTPLVDLINPGQLSVIAMNKMSDELRFVVISALVRRIIRARIEASENEKRLKITPGLTEQDREKISERLAQAIPPTWIVLDEAQNALPSERKTSTSEVLIKLVREGRNFGLSFMITTQQPSAVNQRILSQVDTIIAHKLTVQGDIDYVRNNLKSNLPIEIKYGNDPLSFEQLLRLLDTGQALVSNTEEKRSFIVDLRPRVSVHGGF
jgi:hypothetical protein